MSDVVLPFIVYTCTMLFGDTTQNVKSSLQDTTMCDAGTIWKLRQHYQSLSLVWLYVVPNAKKKLRNSARKRPQWFYVVSWYVN